MRKLTIAASLLAGILAAGSASAAGIAAGPSPQEQSPLLHRIDDPSLGEVLRWRLGQPDRRWDDDNRISRSEYQNRLRRLDAERRELRRDYREDRRELAERRDDGGWRQDRRDRDWIESGREDDAQRFFRRFFAQ